MVLFALGDGIVRHRSRQLTPLTVVDRRQRFVVFLSRGKSTAAYLFLGGKSVPERRLPPATLGGTDCVVDGGPRASKRFLSFPPKRQSCFRSMNHKEPAVAANNHILAGFQPLVRGLCSTYPTGADPRSCPPPKHCRPPCHISNRMATTMRMTRPTPIIESNDERQTKGDSGRIMTVVRNPRAFKMRPPRSRIRSPQR